jgi:taurine dioxygenase
MAAHVLNRLEVRPTGASLGADVIGANLPDPSPSEMEQIRNALHEHLVLRFRGYDLSDVDFARFARRFGPLKPSPDYTRSRKVYVEDVPEMTVISNVTEDGKPVGEHGDGELNWHTDLAFEEFPSTLTFLLAREAPPEGGDTSFCNMYKAAELVSEDDWPRLTRFRLKHQCSHNAQGGRRPGYQDIETDDPREMPGPLHPILRTHPETGRKALYLGRRFGGYIPGLPLAKSDALIDELWSYAARPEDVWTQKWQPGDLIIWDNRCTMHRRDGFAGKGRRRMHRLTTEGERPV